MDERASLLPLGRRVWLICRECGSETSQLHDWWACDGCWYTFCGGDLAPDSELLGHVTARLA